MALYDVVAYSYKADEYCPPCAIDEVADRNDIDHSTLPMGSSFEADLTILSERFKIDRNREETFDSADFPKVIFRDQLEEGRNCGRCHCELDDTQLTFDRSI